MVSRIISNDGKWTEKFHETTKPTVGSKEQQHAMKPNTFPFSLLHTLLLPVVIHPYSNLFISTFQRLMLVQTEEDMKKNGPRSPIVRFFAGLIYLFFKTCSVTGEEIFSLMPLLFWFYFPISVPFATNFGVILTAGQVFKDVLLLPRPPAVSYIPSSTSDVSSKTNKAVYITKLEKHFETEYGMPSTHTMSGLLPFAVYYASQRLTNNTLISWNFCVAYSTLVAFSRLYMGVHSPADITGGACLGWTILVLLHSYGDAFDHAVYVSSYGILISTTLTTLYLTRCPKARPWSASFGTATQIYGTWAGVASSLWFIHHVHPALLVALKTSYDQTSSMNIYAAIASFFIGTNNLFDFLHNLYRLFTCTCSLRIIVGSISTALAKVLSKKIANVVFIHIYRKKWFFPVQHPLDLKDATGRVVPEQKMYQVEVPVRMISYGCVAWSTIVFTPWYWILLGLV